LLPTEEASKKNRRSVVETITELATKIEIKPRSKTEEREKEELNKKNKRKEGSLWREQERNKAKLENL